MNFIKLIRFSRLNKPIYKQIRISKAKYSKLYEPDYLMVGKSEIPQYPALNVQISGYDYPVLEKYQKFLHRAADLINLDVDNGFPLPSKTLAIEKFKPQSSVIDTEYKLSIYQRNIQIVDVESHLLSIYLKLIEASAPEGVNIEVQPYSPLLEEDRYVPDKELNELKQQLEVMMEAKKKS